MKEKRIYQLSLALPIMFPAICLLITPHDLDSIAQPIGSVLITVIFSGVLGVIPYGILAFSLLIWMRNKNLLQIRRALLLSPVLLIPIFLICMAIYVAATFLDDTASGSAVQVYLLYFAVFTGYILAFGYFYVLIAFGLARIFRKKPFSELEA